MITSNTTCRRSVLVRMIGAAIALRAALVIIGLGRFMEWRYEVSTTINGILPIRECLHLWEYGVSPYTGSACKAPPLLLWILSGFSHSASMSCLPGIVCDALAGLLLRDIQAAVIQLQQPCTQAGISLRSSGASVLQAGPAFPYLAFAYLFNPLIISACISSSTSPIENLCVIATLYFACKHNTAMAALLTACGTYIGLHQLLLMLPVCFLLTSGPEGRSTDSHSSSLKGATDASNLHSAPELPLSGDQQADLDPPVTPPPPPPPPPPVVTKSSLVDAVTSTGFKAKPKSWKKRPAVRYIFFVAIFLGSLILLSDLSLNDFPQERCFPAAATALNSRFNRLAGTSGSAHPGKVSGLTESTPYAASDGVCHNIARPAATDSQLPSPHHSAQCPELKNKRTSDVDSCNGGATNGRCDKAVASQGHFCWLTAAYRSQLLIDDVTPNLGQWWYFFMEMFDAYKPFFRFVAHSSTVIMAVPLAVRFPRRPVFLFVVQTLVTALFRPYPSVADLGLALSLLPLLMPQLEKCGSVLFMGVTFALLGVLGPAMLHQWLAVESANSNFYYSITLLGGAWQVALVVQLLLLTVSLEQGVGVVEQTAGASIAGSLKESQDEQLAPGKEEIFASHLL